LARQLLGSFRAEFLVVRDETTSMNASGLTPRQA